MKKNVMNMVSAHFRPEYLNKLDEIIIFHALLKKVYQGYCFITGRKTCRKGKNAAGTALFFTDTVLEHISNEGFDPTYGARPVKRFIQREIENALALEILTRKLPEKVTVDFDGKNVVF